MVESELWVGVAAVPLISGIVQMLRSAGLPARFSGLVAIVVGMILATGSMLSDAELTLIQRPAIIEALGQGLMAGLGASGFYDVTKAATNRVAFGDGRGDDG